MAEALDDKQTFNFLSSRIKRFTSQGGELPPTDRSDLTKSPLIHKQQDGRAWYSKDAMIHTILSVRIVDSSS